MAFICWDLQQSLLTLRSTGGRRAIGGCTFLCFHNVKHALLFYIEYSIFICLHSSHPVQMKRFSGKNWSISICTFSGLSIISQILHRSLLIQEDCFPNHISIYYVKVSGKYAKLSPYFILMIISFLSF